jgi:hypothetical protein
MNMNLNGAMSRLFAEARGTYIGMQHDHDLYGRDFLREMVALMERHGSAGFGCCAYSLIDEEGRRLAEPDISEFRLFPPSGVLPGQELIKVLATRVHTPIPAMATLFRRATVEQAGGYRPDWRLASDEDLYRRMASISDVAFCPNRLFQMRVRPPERRHVHGGWAGLYTLYEFRQETTDSYFRDDAFFRLFNKIRLAFRYYHAFLVESLSQWSHGDRLNLEKALGYRPIREGREVLNPVARIAFAALIRLLSSTVRLGMWLGEFRRARKSKSSPLASGKETSR